MWVAVIFPSFTNNYKTEELGMCDYQFFRQGVLASKIEEKAVAVTV